MRRAARYALAAVLAAALLGLGSAQAGSKRRAAAPKALYGIVRTDVRSDTWKLERLDPRTLAPRSRPRVEVDQSQPWALSPDGTRLAIGFELVDVRRMHPMGYVRLDEAADPYAVAWVTPDRLLAVVSGCCQSGDDPNPIFLLAIDPLARRVIDRVPLGATEDQFLIPHVTRTGDGIAFLLRPETGTGPVRLVVASADGAVRSTRIDRVPAGWRSGPALAVDAARGRAFVAGSGTPVAEVRLADLQVYYHAPAAPVSLFSWLSPAAEAKTLADSVRTASYLPSGLIAVTGREYSDHLDEDGVYHWSRTPAGLSLVDPANWSVRSVDPRVAKVVVADDLLLAFGVKTQSPEQPASTGMGLSAYSLDGTLRFHVLGSFAVDRVQVFGHYAYVNAGGSGYRRVVDLRSGRIVKAGWIGPRTLLTGDRSWDDVTDF